MYVWDKPYYEKGMLPKRIFLEKGTILIDSTLTEDDDRGRENFTVIHETFHQVLHKRCFAHAKADYTHTTTAKSLGEKRKPKTAIEIIEYQANSCAAYFLMPRNVVLSIYDKFVSGSISSDSKQSWAIAYKMAPEFNVSATAMHYRLEKLKKFI
jgi:Zn-dependent peptidase ImmA (M78 family)